MYDWEVIDQTTTISNAEKKGKLTVELSSKSKSLILKLDKWAHANLIMLTNSSNFPNSNNVQTRFHKTDMQNFMTLGNTIYTNNHQYKFWELNKILMPGKLAEQSYSQK